MKKTNIEKPILIIGCPRSGTTLLFTLLNSSPEIHSLYEESRFLFRKFYINKEREGISYHDDALSPSDMNEKEREALLDDFHNHSFKSRLLGQLVNKGIRKYSITRWLAGYFAKINGAFKNKPYRLVEKTPRNCFKIDLLNELFPDAYFVFIKRDGKSNISSLIQGWKKRKKEVLDEIKRVPRIDKELSFTNFDGKLWRFALPPGWQDYSDRSLEEACAHQWRKSNEDALVGLEKIPDSRKITISYEDLVEDTPTVIKGICDFAEIEYNSKIQSLVEKPPEVNYLDGKPQRDKWKQNADAITKIRPMVEETMIKLGYGFED